MVSESALDVLLEVPLPPVSSGSGEELAGLLTAQRELVREADFVSLLSLSWTLLGAGKGHGSAVRAVRRSSAAQAGAALEGLAELRAGLSELAARGDHAAQAQGIRGQLEAIDPALAARAGPLLDQVEAGQIDPGPFEEAGVTAGVLGGAPGTEFEADLCVAAVTRGLLGVVHSLVNAPEPEELDLSRFTQALEEQHQAAVAVTEELHGAESALYAAFSEGDRATIDRAAATLVESVEQVLVPCAALQARGRAWRAALREAGRGGDAERVGRALAGSGLLLRRAVADAAAAQWVILELASADLSGPITDLLEGAGGPFEAALPNGRDVELAHLGPEGDGVFVQVEGFVEEASAAREPDGKLVGRLLLLDPSSGATAEVSTVFVHPPHIGITLGCFVVVHGVYRASSARLGGRAGVEADVLAPGQLSRQSWQARLWFAAGRWIDVWRGDLNLSWSLGTHTPGPDDSDEPTRGAAELIFVPFAREQV